MSQVMNTPNGPLLCSRINAGSAERGDLLVSEQERFTIRIIDTRRDYRTGQVTLHLAGTVANWHVRIGINEPVWRAVGARAAGLIT